MESKVQIHNFLKLKGFKLIAQGTSEYFGDYYEAFSSNNFELRISRSKSFEIVDICSIYEKGKWYDLALVKSLLYKEDNLNRVTSDVEHIEFLKKKLDSICELFSKLNYAITKRKLEEFGDERAKQVFPGRI